MENLTRRDFLKFCAAGISTLALDLFPRPIPPEGIEKPIGKALQHSASVIRDQNFRHSPR
jgi:hypothetical protein